MKHDKSLAHNMPNEDGYNPSSPDTEDNHYTSLSLNQLIQEGIRGYRLKDKKRAHFDLNLCGTLHRIAGEPAQLRRVFAQLVDCLVECTQSEVPNLKVMSRNITVSANEIGEHAQRERLAPGTYVLLQVTIDSLCYLPRITLAEENHRDACGSTMQTRLSNNFNFAWSQICEVIEVHGGLIVGKREEGRIHPQLTIVDVMLPAFSKVAPKAAEVAPKTPEISTKKEPPVEKAMISPPVMKTFALDSYSLIQ